MPPPIMPDLWPPIIPDPEFDR